MEAIKKLIEKYKKAINDLTELRQTKKLNYIASLGISNQIGIFKEVIKDLEKINKIISNESNRN